MIRASEHYNPMRGFSNCREGILLREQGQTVRTDYINMWQGDAGSGVALARVE